MSKRTYKEEAHLRIRSLVDTIHDEKQSVDAKLQELIKKAEDAASEFYHFNGNRSRFLHKYRAVQQTLQGVVDTMFVVKASFEDPGEDSDTSCSDIGKALTSNPTHPTVVVDESTEVEGQGPQDQPTATHSPGADSVGTTSTLQLHSAEAKGSTPPPQRLENVPVQESSTEHASVSQNTAPLSHSPTMDAAKNHAVPRDQNRKDSAGSAQASGSGTGVDMQNEEKTSAKEAAGPEASGSSSFQGKQLPRLKLQNGVGLDVVVTGIQNPSLFSVQVPNADFSAFSQQLHSCMTAEGDKSALMEEPQVGLVVCAKFIDGHWYRACITSVGPPNNPGAEKTQWVEVVYVDYGNSAKIPVQNIRPLHDSFCQLPMQAFQCALSNVGSLKLNTEWEADATLELARMVRPNNDLLVHIVPYCEANAPIVFVDLYASPVPYASNQRPPMSTFMFCNQALIDSNLASPMLNQVIVDALPQKSKIDWMLFPEFVSKPTSCHSSGSHGSTSRKSAARIAQASSETEVKSVVKCTSKEATPPAPSAPQPVEIEPVEEPVAKQEDDFDDFIIDDEFEQKLDKEVAENHQTGRATSNTEEPGTKNCLSTYLPRLKVTFEPGEECFLNFMMSHIESPHEFYIHPVSEVCGETLKTLKSELNKCYKCATKDVMRRFFKEHTLQIGDFCCAQFTRDGSYYRAQVRDITYEQGKISKLFVYYVDFGNSEWLPQLKVFPLQERFLEHPALAIRVKAVDLEPVRGTEWSAEAVRSFVKLTGFKDELSGFCIQYKAGTTVDFIVYDRLEMSIWDPRKGQEGWIMDKMAKLGHCAGFNSTISDDSAESKMRKPRTSPALAPLDEPDDSNEVKPMKSKRCAALSPIDDSDFPDPMAEDYLSLRNSYGVDIDDPGVATMGYRKTSRSNRFLF